MIKKFYILLIFILGFFLTPSMTFACGSKTEKSCCEKKISKKSDTKDCCKKNKQEPNDKDDCGGKCGSKSCHCPAFHFSIITSFSQENSNNTFSLSEEKQKISYLETYLSSGFYSIWTPPNIC